jgi:F-type H+-transporting ATPase subunit delta
MLVVKIAVPYAEALLELANENNSLKETTNDMNVVSKLLVSSSDLKKFLGNPIITREIKKRTLRDVLVEHVEEKTLTFLMLLVDRNRIAYLDSIAYKFIELSYNQESIEIAKVTSSVRLSSDQQKGIATKLKEITGARQIKLALKVDPTLIGGFTIEIGSKLIDTSIRGQLNQISSFLGAAKV